MLVSVKFLLQQLDGACVFVASDNCILRIQLGSIFQSHFLAEYRFRATVFSFMRAEITHV